MKRLSALLGLLSDWTWRASEGVVELGPVVVTTAKYVEQRERKSFELGCDAGRLGFKPAPEPQPARVLSIVGGGDR